MTKVVFQRTPRAFLYRTQDMINVLPGDYVSEGGVFISITAKG